MADIITYPENGITYDADDASGYLATRLSGVYSAEEDFAVTAQGGLSVQVSAGQAWVRPARFKGRSIIMEQPTTVVLTEADPVRSRIDRVVLRYDAAAKKTRLQVLEGVPNSAGPAAPAITRTELIYDLCLAEIKRPAGSTAVTAADIYDTRADETVCGVMRDGVHGIPTGTLVQQWKAVIESHEGWQLLYPCRGGCAVEKLEKRGSFSRGQHLPEHRTYKPCRTVRRYMAGDCAEPGTDGCWQRPRSGHHRGGRTAEHHRLFCRGCKKG